MLRSGLSIFLILGLTLISAAQIDPLSLPGLELWVNSDQGVQISGGLVIQWNDQSGNSNNLLQGGATRRPALVEEVLNGHPVLRFDGSTDFMNFPAINTIRTVFWVISEDADAAQSFKCLLGHTDSFHFLRGANGTFWNQDFANPFILNGSTRILSEEVDILSTPIPSGFKVFSLVTSGPVEADRFSRDRSNNSTVWDGDIAQLLIFSDSLSNQEILGVEQYLYNYYTAPLDLGDDIDLGNSLCDTTLIANPGYLAYLWSDGSSNDSLIVNSSGTYWVDATDVFGRVVRDSIEVSYPGNFNPGGGFLCLGESYSWDTGLDPELFDISWQDGSNGSSFTVSEDSVLQVTVSDLQGCTLISAPLQVNVDEFANEISLGADQSSCIGQTLGIVGGAFPGLVYSWSDGSEENELIYNGQSEVWVEVINANNCIAQDTIQVTSLGNAPQLDFSVESICLNDETQFTDQSSGDSELISWVWDFGDNASAEGSQVSHQFSDSGTFLVSLQVEDANGCRNQIDTEIAISPLPIADFNYTFPCSGDTVSFGDNSSSLEGEIIFWNWTFPGTTLEAQNAQFLFSEVGFQAVSLEVQTDLGCTGFSQQLVNVSPSPEISILADGFCLGSFTELSYDYLDNGAGEALQNSWSFGDATSSSQSAPLHFYQLPGNYEIGLEVLSEVGCVAEASLSITIDPLPIPFAENLDFCVGVTEVPLDQSSSSGSPIASWEWVIEGLGLFDGNAPELQFTEAGTYSFQLRVTTEANCYGIYIGTMNTFEVPELEASFSPDIGEAPFQVELVASSDQDCTFEWDFGLGITEQGPIVQYTFMDNGLNPVLVTATNTNECSSFLSLQVPVQEPLMDVVLLNAELIDSRVIVLLRNEGNYRLTEIDFRQYFLGGTASSELWEGELLPGQNLAFEFNAQLGSTGRAEPILCIEAMPISFTQDLNLDNNQGCISLAGVSELFDPFPNPAQQSTSIHFNLGSDELVQIELIDELGRQVWSLENWPAQEGYNRIIADISNLQSGIYVVHLSYRGRNFTKYLMME